MVARKKITIYDVARACNVSYATVSRTLNGHPDVSEETKARILEKCRELGYSPSAQAKGLAKNKSWLVGVVFEDSFENPFWSKLLTNMRSVLETHGYELILMNENLGNGRSIAERIAYRSLEGLIVAGSGQKLDVIEYLNEVRIPVVTINFRLKMHSAVISAQYKGMREMLDYLWKRGHRRIGFAAGDLSTTSARFRFNAYKAFLESRNVEYDESIVIFSDFTVGPRTDCFREVCRMVENGNVPTAFCCSYDIMAIGVIEALQEHGFRVPEDVSVTGFDDLECIQFFHPKITTISQNRELMGIAAGEEILSKLEHRNDSIRTISIPTEIVLRDSVADRMI